MKWFNYSIIKYMPNPKRGEVVNIGLVVFKDPELDIRLLDKPSKVNLLDNTVNYDDILKLEEKFKEIANIIQNPDEQFCLLKGSGYGLFLSERASFSVDSENKETYEKEVIELYNELIKLPTRKKDTSNYRIQTILKEKFESLNIFSKNRDELANHKVLQNYKFDDSNPELVADFMLKNGKYHLTETVDFNINNKNEKLKEACLKTMIFSESQRVYGEELVKRYFVYSADAKKENEITTTLNFVQKNCERMYNIESKEDELKYFDEIAKLISR